MLDASPKTSRARPLPRSSLNLNRPRNTKIYPIGKVPVTMATIFRPFRYLTVRRSSQYRPYQIFQSLLPPRLCRLITVQAPGPNSSSDQTGPIDFDDVGTSISTSPPSYQHPLADRSQPSSSDPSSSRSVVTTLPSPPDKILSTPPPHMQHPFDTHAFVSYLEKADLVPETARTLMEAVRLLIVRRGEKSRDDLVGKEDMENVSVRWSYPELWTIMRAVFLADR